MRQRYKRDLLVEPPSVATGDIAFNLIVFFLVCASTQPDSGRAQQLPRAEQNKQQQQQAQNLEVTLTREAFLLDGAPVREKELEKRLRQKLSAKTSPSERVVVLKSDKATPYHHWIRASIAIERAGGLITIQREETKVQAAP